MLPLSRGSHGEGLEEGVGGKGKRGEGRGRRYESNQFALKSGGNLRLARTAEIRMASIMAIARRSARASARSDCFNSSGKGRA